MSDPIQTLLARYADGVCRFDPEQWGATWAEDAVWEMGPRSWTGRDEIVAAWEKMLSALDGVIHNYLQGWADLDEASGVGTGRWYVMEHFQRPGHDTQTLYGYYDDQYRRVDGQWLFSHRVLTSIYRGPPDLSAPFTGFNPA